MMRNLSNSVPAASSYGKADVDELRPPFGRQAALRRLRRDRADGGQNRLHIFVDMLLLGSLHDSKQDAVQVFSVGGLTKCRLVWMVESIEAP